MSAPPQKARRNHFATLRSLGPYLWPTETNLRVRVIGAMIFLIGAKLVSVATPMLFKRSIDALTPHGDAVILVPLGMVLAYGGARILSQAFGEIRDAIFAKVGSRAIRMVGLTVFRHLHALSLRFHLDRQTGGLSRVVERGTKGIDFLLSFMLFNILPTLLEISLVTVVLWRLYDARFALTAFATIGIYIAFTLSITEWRTKYRRQMNETDQEANAKAIDSLLNFETVKYFGNEAHETERFDKSLLRYEKASNISKVSLSLLNIGQGVIIALGLTAIMLMAAQEVVAGKMQVGDFVLVNTYLIQLYLPLNFLGFVYREIKQSLIDMEAMFVLLTEPQEVSDKEGAPELALSGGELRFEDVHFGYNPDREILKGISFTVPAGKTVAIVGPSGAGKSTISRLLFRFYDVTGGSVKIDGQDLREVAQRSLRGAIGIVPQDTVLFNDTVYYNIAYGRPGSPKEAVEHAAQMARIHDFVTALPQGYETKVGERGLKLSGGEKQRVAIARSILKQPAIMLFDEATSALDTHTEREIQNNLRELSRGRTTLVIAHRLSTVVDADEIIVLADGRVAERGRHGTLLARNGLYARMWALQAEQEAEAEVAD